MNHKLVWLIRVKYEAHQLPAKPHKTVTKQWSKKHQHIFLRRPKTYKSTQVKVQESVWISVNVLDCKLHQYIELTHSLIWITADMTFIYMPPSKVLILPKIPWFAGSAEALERQAPFKTVIGNKRAQTSRKHRAFRSFFILSLLLHTSPS